jgi:hypothetical protein
MCNDLHAFAQHVCIPCNHVYSPAYNETLVTLVVADSSTYSHISGQRLGKEIIAHFNPLVNRKYLSDLFLKLFMLSACADVHRTKVPLSDYTILK